MLSLCTPELVQEPTMLKAYNLQVIQCPWLCSFFLCFGPKTNHMVPRGAYREG